MAKATILRKGGKPWLQREAASLQCTHKVAVHEEGAALILEGHHEKRTIASELGLNPDKLGDNDFQCEPTEIDISVKA